MSNRPNQRVLRAVSWSVLGTGSAQAIILVASVVVARLLGEEDFGRLGLIQFTMNLAYGIVASSIGWTVMRTVANLRAEGHGQLGAELSALLSVGGASSVLLALLLGGSSEWIATSLFRDTKLSLALLFTSISVLFGTLYSIFLSGLSGFEAFRAVALLNIVRGILLGIGIVGGAFWGSLEGTVVAMGLAHFISTVLVYLQFTRTLQKCSVRLISPNLLLGLNLAVKFSLPAFLSTLFASMMPWWGSVFLSRNASSLSEVAVLNVANYWRTLVMFLPTQIAQSTAPVLSNLWAHRDYTQVRKIVKTNLKMIAGIILLSLAPLIFLANWVLNLYGLSAPQQELAFRLLLVSAVFTALCAPLGYTLVAMGRFWTGFVVNTIWAMLFLAGAWLTVVQIDMGVVGLGWTYLTGYIVLFIVSLIVTMHGLRSVQRVEAER
ncbi:MAG: oligosaccharide flippase family protein [Fimbriimonadales bacterium]